METPEQNSLEARGSGKPGSSKLWLLIVPLLGACTLAVCLAGSGLLWWFNRDGETAGQEETSLAGESELPQGEIKDTLTLPTTPTPRPGQLPTPAPDDQAGATRCEWPPVEKQPVRVREPVLSPITFATRQDARDWPLDASLQFTSTVRTVQASFSYLGLRDGLEWERVWYFEGEEMLQGKGVWDAGSQGKLTLYAQVAEQGFVAGRYRLEIYVAGALVGQGSFDVVPEDAPTGRPVQVAYTTWEKDRHRLNLLNVEDGQREVLVEFASRPAWSADAVGLLFAGEPGIEGGTPGLWVLNTGQGQTYQLSEETWFGNLAWSPHRTFVATSTGQEPPRLRLWQVAENKTVDGPPGQEPAWSPDGMRLAYRACNDGRWGISAMGVISNVFDLASIQPLTVGDDRQPAWSWDGQRIAFVRREDNSQAIYTIAYDGTDLRRLSTGPASDSSPAWTPDHRLVFRSWEDGQGGIYVMNADGSGRRRLATIPSNFDWEPDGLAVSTDTLPAEALPTKPRVQIPPGHGLLVVSNQKNSDEMTFTIDNKEHKIGPYQLRYLPLRPGHYTWTASWPAKVSRTGIADLAAGQVAYPVVER